ncbi:MAG: Sjogren's syndrome/scleroderma autoantigen 1 family protein [Candidatus Bathyarchaeia archaeon]
MVVHEEMESEKESLKRMSDLLKAGATMLPEQCPECNSPLFKIGDEIWCPQCNRRVIIVKADEEITRVATPLMIGAIEETVLTKLQEINRLIQNENDPDRLQKLGELLSTWVGLLERLRRVREAQGSPSS